MRIFIAAVFLLSLSTQGVLSADCWKSAYGRGVGKPISACPEGQENDASLCYPVCREGYTGVGPVCWQDCPAGFADTGADCLKPDSYGRGAGYTSEGACRKDNDDGCEMWGLLWYPICRNGFHNAACCVCSPNCINGMTDIGVSCQKKSYGRGVGKPLQCKSNEQYDAGLCYSYCDAHYTNVGPVCWAECPAGKYECGALCVQGGVDECTETVKQIVGDVFQAAVSIAQAATGNIDIVDIITKIGKVALDLANGVCPAPTAVEFLLQRR